MSVQTPKRLFLFVLGFLFVSASVFAANPSPRTMARMAFHEETRQGVLFGGRGPHDTATGVSHSSAETWLWSGTRWVQRFPIRHPAARDSHSMVYDSKRERVLLFGGRQEPGTSDERATFFNDLWAWDGSEWTRIDTPTTPPARGNAAMAYDRARDRVVLFGGNIYGPDNEKIVAALDTWEFDGNDWTLVANGTPDIGKPVAAYDQARNETIVLGVLNDSTLAPAMYRYDAAGAAWVRVTPEKVPPCVNEGHMVYQSHDQTLLWLGGVCPTNTPGVDEVYTWDGTNWTKATVGEIPRGVGQAVMYDDSRRSLVVYGGSLTALNELRSFTYLLRDGAWKGIGGVGMRPAPRSLMALNGDPQRAIVWMFGGLHESSDAYHSDFWGYRNGQWYRAETQNGPGEGCASPLAAFDSNRGRLVVACGGSSVFEWDGTAWKSVTSSRSPEIRRFAAMVYDETLKKTVLFGGYGVNYLNDTWLWDGSQWTEVKGDKPEHRALMSMWYDPLLKKTVLYGGLGRRNLEEKIQRHADMWSFNGTGWTKMNVTETPGMRFGAQIAVNPESGKLVLFGGLRAEQIDEKTLTQFYGDDMWEWDGSANRWTRLTPPRSPSPRENGSLGWDPSINKMVLFGGYKGGFYYSDVWVWDGQNWEPRLEHTGRRRAAGSGN